MEMRSQSPVMQYTVKTFIFIIVFTLIFTCVRLVDDGNLVTVQMEELGGIPWLYSVIGLVFSILSGFIIQKQWENWQKLHDAILSEASSLNKIWLMAKYSSESDATIIRVLIKKYLAHVIHNEWQKKELYVNTERGEKFVFEMNEILIESARKSATNSYSLDLVAELYEKRLKRLLLMSHQLPAVLDRIIMFNAYMLISLSLFIGVKNFYLDYLFTLGIGILIYVIQLIIKDLSEVTLPGAWYVEPSQFQLLLERFKNEESRGDGVSKNHANDIDSFQAEPGNG